LGVCKTVFPIFHVPEELLVYEPPPEIVAAQKAALRRTHVLNATVALGILGLLMSGLLGAGEAAVRRFDRGALMGLGVGAVLGTCMSCLSGLIGQSLMERLLFVQSLVPIAKTTLGQTCTLGLLGLGVGVALALAAGSGRRLSTFAGAGALAGILAGMLYPVTCAFVMYRVETEGAAIPGGVIGGRSETWGLAFWVGLLVVTMSLIIPLVTRRKTSVATDDRRRA
jgi:hypothetical protein